MDRAKYRLAVRDQTSRDERKTPPRERDTASGEQDQEPRGRGASGESYEDEADNALLRRSGHPDVDGRGTQ